MLRFAIILACAGCVLAIDMQIPYTWKYIEFLSNNDTWKENYDYTNVIPYDVQTHKVRCNRVWVTTPRFRGSNFPTLSTISDQYSEGGPLLEPYPSWEWHIEGNCSGMTNVLRVAIDDCHRLWVVDSGIVGTEQVCQAQILSFSLETNDLLTRYMISDEVSKGGLLRLYAVETEGPNCEKTRLYAPDVNGTGIVIFDGTSAWRLESDYLKPDPSFRNLTIGDDSFVADVGPYGIMLVENKFVQTGLAAVWSLNSKRMYAINIDDLHNSKYSQENLTWYQSQFDFPSQLGAAVISKEGVTFATFLMQEDLICVWLKNPPTQEHIVVLGHYQDSLSSIASMKISDDEQGNEELWFLTNHFTQWFNRHTNYSQENFQIKVSRVATLINGTMCEPTTYHSVPPTIDNWGYNRL